MADSKSVIKKFDEFTKELVEFLGNLPMDLTQTLQDVREEIVRRKKDGK